MSIMPKTVCQRCHRRYPAIRGRCPYCGTRKPKAVKTAVPESDSAVKGTAAARRAREDTNWQMLIGGVLLVCVIAAVIAIVSVNVKERVGDAGTAQAEDIQDALADTTPLPSFTPVPTSTPEPTPTVTQIEIQYYGAEKIDFMEPAGSQVKLDAVTYPITSEPVEVEWYSTDETIATVDQDGLVTVLGEYGQSCDIVAKAPNGMEAKCKVYCGQ